MATNYVNCVHILVFKGSSLSLCNAANVSTDNFCFAGDSIVLNQHSYLVLVKVPKFSRRVKIALMPRNKKSVIRMTRCLLAGPDCQIDGFALIVKSCQNVVWPVNRLISFVHVTRIWLGTQIGRYCHQASSLRKIYGVRMFLSKIKALLRKDVLVLCVSVDKVGISNHTKLIAFDVPAEKHNHIFFADLPTQTLLFLGRIIHGRFVGSWRNQWLFPADKVYVSIEVRSRHFIRMRSRTFDWKHDNVYHVLQGRIFHRSEFPHVTRMKAWIFGDYHGASQHTSIDARLTEVRRILYEYFAVFQRPCFVGSSHHDAAFVRIDFNARSLQKFTEFVSINCQQNGTQERLSCQCYSTV